MRRGWLEGVGEMDGERGQRVVQGRLLINFNFFLSGTSGVPHHLVSHLVHVAISLIKVFDERAVKDAVRRQHSVGKHNAWSARSFVVLFKVFLTP